MSASQSSIDTILAPVGKSGSAFDIQAVIICSSNGGAKKNNFFDCIESIVIGRKLAMATYTLFALI